MTLLPLPVHSGSGKIAGGQAASQGCAASVEWAASAIRQSARVNNPHVTTYRKPRYEELERRIQIAALIFGALVTAFLIYVMHPLHHWLSPDVYWAELLATMLHVLSLACGLAAYLLVEHFICRRIPSRETGPEATKATAITYLPSEFTEGTVFVSVEGTPVTIVDGYICSAWEPSHLRSFPLEMARGTGQRVSEAEFRDLVQGVSRKRRYKFDYRTTEWMG